MDMLSPPTSLFPPKSNSWPDVRAVNGKYYGITDQHGDKITAMTHDTWVQVGTMMENLNRHKKESENALKRQHEAIFHLNMANKAMAAELSELREKHKNLKKAYRKAKYAELEPEVEKVVEPAKTTSFNPLG